MSNTPASKYGDTEFHRTHNRYTPATAPLAFMLTLIDEAEFQTLEANVFERTAGLVELGNEQFAAIMKADESLETLGIEAPTIETLWLEAAAMAPGSNDVIEAAINRKQKNRSAHAKSEKE